MRMSIIIIEMIRYLHHLALSIENEIGLMFELNLSIFDNRIFTGKSVQDFSNFFCVVFFLYNQLIAFGIIV